jgi:lysophospholipase L1-like esterase
MTRRLATVDTDDGEVRPAFKVPESSLPERLSVESQNATYAPRWKASTAYAAGDRVITPLGDVATASVAFTSGTAFDATKWNYPKLPVSIRSTASMSKWLAKVAAVRAGTSSAKVLCVGDSTTNGVFSGSTLATSYPTALKRRLGLHMPTGDGLAVAQSTASRDTRWTPGGYSWSGTVGPWGASWYSAAGAGTDLSYAPGVTVDTFDVWVYHSGAAGTAVGVKIDGVSQTAINASTGPNGWTKHSYTTTAGTHTIAIAKPATGELYVLGVDAYLSTLTTVRVSNWGIPGADSAGWTTLTGSTEAIEKYQPDLTIIMLGINEAGGAMLGPEYSGYIGTLIQKAQLTGDAILCSVVQSNPATESARVAKEAVFRDSVNTLSGAYDIPFIDVFTVLGPYETVHGYWSDDLHLTAKGYSRLGRIIYQGVMAS